MYLFLKMFLLFIRKIKLTSQSMISQVVIFVEGVDKSSGIKVRGRINVRNAGLIKIGKNVTITSSLSVNPVGGVPRTSLYTSKSGSIYIGNNVGMSNCTIFSMESIIIDEDVLLGGGVSIYDTDFHSIYYKERIQKNDPGISTAKVLLKKGCFIGSGVTILKGVTIGEQSVVGARSVVTKNIPDREIWGGSPARFIKKIQKTK